MSHHQPVSPPAHTEVNPVEDSQMSDGNGRGAEADESRMEEEEFVDPGGPWIRSQCDVQ